MIVSLVTQFRASLAAVVVLASSVAFAAEGRVESLRAGDNQPITITYYPVATGANSGSKENAPVAVLLHGNDKGRILWDKMVPRADKSGKKVNFIDSLVEDGWAVVTVDLRKFGDSKAPNENPNIRPDDYEKMAAWDLPAVKQFLYEKHQAKELNMNKMAIVAAGPTVPVAVYYAAADWLAEPYDDAPVLATRTPRGQDVRALVLLSPETTGRLPINKGLQVIRDPAKGVGVLTVAGKQDPLDKGQAKKVFDTLEGPQKKTDLRMYLSTPNLKDRELGLMGKAPDQVEAPIREFLNKHVKDLNSPWRDRKNKVTG